MSPLASRPILAIAACSLLLAVAICNYSLGAGNGATNLNYVKPNLRSAVTSAVPEQSLKSAAVPRKSTSQHLQTLQGPTKSKKAAITEPSGSLALGALGIGAFVAAAATYVWKRGAPKTPQAWATAAIALEEDYPGPGSPDKVYEVKVVWEGEEKTIKVRGDQSILMACEEVGLVVPYMCRHGVCLECTAKVVEGIENARKDSQCHNTENIRSGFVCTCSTYAGGPMKLIMGCKEEAYKAQFGKFEEEERQREEKKKGFLGGMFTRSEMQ